jgi:hypothetical protein
MENLNEGKKKTSAYMAELAEIDKQSAVVAMEAKINKLAEMVEAKTQRLSMVHEDENLSELIDKKRVKMMEREIKEIEKAKLKLEKLYEKMTGGKKKEVVDEEMDDNINPGNTEEDQAKKDAYDYDARPAHMKEGEDSTYEEDDTIDEAGNIDSDQEPKSFLKKTSYSAMEEVSRWQKLAGVISEEEYRNRLNEAMDVKSANDMRDEMVKSFGRDNLMGAAKLEIVGADKSEVKDAAELGRMTLQNMLSAIFKKYGPNFSSVTEKGKLSITPQSKEGGALGYSFVITQ